MSEDHERAIENEANLRLSLQKKYQELLFLRLDLSKANFKIEELEGLLRESIMRAGLALPETEQDEIWTREGVSISASDFIERAFKTVGLGKFNPASPFDTDR